MASSCPEPPDREHTPLLSGPPRPAEAVDGQPSNVCHHSDAIATEVAREEADRSNWYLFMLTLALGGLQIVWSVEMSNGSPYLLSLGMDKSLLALVWIAGPLTGALVQPYIGIRSDNCQLRWGKRRPFMLGGALATVVVLLCLAWVREIVGGMAAMLRSLDGSVTSSAASEDDDAVVRVWTLILATVLMYCLDFAINTVQASSRAFIVDNAPVHQQDAANAWASRMTGAGNIIGYLSGYLDLPRLFPLFGESQFKVLCVIGSMAFIILLLASCISISERDPRMEGPPVTGDQSGVLFFFRDIVYSIRRLPPQIRRVCQVQLCAWIGWFPFLFYITTYIGQLVVDPVLRKNLPESDIERAWGVATRTGAFALLIEAVVSLTANVVLPFFVMPMKNWRRSCHVGGEQFGVQRSRDSVHPEGPYLSRAPSTSSLSFTTTMGPAVSPPKDTGEEEPSLLPVTAPGREGRCRRRCTHRWLSRLRIPGLTLRRVWLGSHLLFAAAMFSTVFISTPRAGIIMVSVVGVSWALTLWAPFALISAEVARRRDFPGVTGRMYTQYGSVAAPMSSRGSLLSTEELRRRNSGDGDRDDLTGEADGDDSTTIYPSEADGNDARAFGAFAETPFSPSAHRRSLSTSTASPTSTLTPTAAAIDMNTGSGTAMTIQAGIVLGIHNMAVSAPQVLSTLISCVIFALRQKPRGEPGDDSVGWVLRFGGCAALVAAWYAQGLEEGDDGS